jgi:hypothetical protein
MSFALSRDQVAIVCLLRTSKGYGGIKAVIQRSHFLYGGHYLVLALLQLVTV